MKKVTVLIALLLGSFYGVAQEKMSSADRSEKATEKMTEAFELTEDETAKVKVINTSFFEKVETIRKNDELDEAGKKEAMKAAREERKEGLKEILTEEEMASLEKKEQAHITKFQDKHPHEKPEDEKKTPEEKAQLKTDKMKEHLDLTDEQLPKVQALNFVLVQKLDGVKKDDNIPADRKNEFIEGNFNDYKISMKTILTEDQYSKFEEMANKREAKRHEKSQMMMEQSKD